MLHTELSIEPGTLELEVLEYYPLACQRGGMCRVILFFFVCFFCLWSGSVYPREVYEIDSSLDV